MKKVTPVCFILSLLVSGLVHARQKPTDMTDWSRLARVRQGSEIKILTKRNQLIRLLVGRVTEDFIQGVDATVFESAHFDVTSIPRLCATGNEKHTLFVDGQTVDVARACRSVERKEIMEVRRAKNPAELKRTIYDSTFSLRPGNSDSWSRVMELRTGTKVILRTKANIVDEVLISEATEDELTFVRASEPTISNLNAKTMASYCTSEQMARRLTVKDKDLFSEL